MGEVQIVNCKVVVVEMGLRESCESCECESCEMFTVPCRVP